MMCDLKYYLAQELVNDKNYDEEYPIGILKGDENHSQITINFEHYSNFTEAKEKWISRAKRVKYDNIYVIMEYYDGIHNEELIELFQKIPYKNKVILTHKDHKEEYTKTIHCFDDSLDLNEIGGKIFRYNGLTGKRYYEDFDYVEFLNKE